MATLGELSPSPFIWVSKVTLGTPAARLPRRFRHSRCWCLGLATPPPSGPLASFLMGFEGDVRHSGREASEAFPSQQVRRARWLVFGAGEASLGGSVATLGGLSPSPFLWVSKVTLGTPAARLPRRLSHSRCWWMAIGTLAARLPRRFRHSRRWCLGLATPPPSGPLAGLRAWRGQSGRERGHFERA